MALTSEQKMQLMELAPRLGQPPVPVLLNSIDETLENYKKLV